MSAEIRAGNTRTYWILNNGTGYIDGVTDSGLITTVGNGWNIYWVGSDYSEYISGCVTIGILPRNYLQDVAFTSNLPIDQSPLFLIDQLSNKIKILDSIDPAVPGERISATQARLWLIRNGFDLNIIDSVIDSIEDPIVRESVRTQWEYAPYVERNHPWLSQLAAILGVDLDKCFNEAIYL